MEDFRSLGHDFGRLITDVSTIADGKEGIFEGEILVSSLDFHDGIFPLMEPIRYHLEILKNKEDFLLSGSVRTKIEGQCVRCLEPAELELTGSVEATYKPASKKKSVGEQEYEELENVIYYEGFSFDLFDRVVEALIVEVPFKILCKEDCRGLCSYCGENLNDSHEHHCEGSKKAAETGRNRGRFEEYFKS